MLWGERVGRRRAVVGLLALAAITPAGIAFLLAHEVGTAPVAASAQPLHPVATRFVPDDTQLMDCSDDSCFQQAFGNIAFRQGPRAALALVGDVYGEGGSAGCHRVVHTIGAASLTRNRGNVSRTFAEGSSRCWSGYYHGVLEYAFLGVKSYRAGPLGHVARTLCRDAMDRMTGWLAWQCLHGLGHGLMISTGLHLPLSLRVCKRLDSWWETDVCKSGVFMENTQPSFGVRSRWQRADDSVYPCNTVAREDKSRCYQMVTSHLLVAVDGDWARTAEICSRVERGFSSVCFGSLGRDAAARTGRNPAGIVAICIVARPFGGEKDCIRAAAMDLTANFTSGLRARPLCDVVTERLRGDCFYGIGVVMGLFRKTEAAREADCRAVVTAPRLVAACVRGGRTTTSRI
jgi:hypothetical protein